MPRRITKNIIFEAHALRRMKQRGVERVIIEEAIADPLSRKPAKRPGAVRITFKINERETIAVIIEETEKFIRVVTTWML